jgi:hypothetical protein
MSFYDDGNELLGSIIPLFHPHCMAVSCVLQWHACCVFQDVFIYVTNRVDFGHLVNADNFDTSRVNSEIYQILDNRWDWEQRYLHENYTENFNPNNTIAQVSPERGVAPSEGTLCLRWVWLKQEQPIETEILGMFLHHTRPVPREEYCLLGRGAV